MLLTGSFFRTLDDKFRFAIPKSIRSALGETAAATFYLAPGTDGSLALYTEESFARLANQLDDVSPNRPDVRSFSRLFYSQAQRVEIDRSGRIRIPVELANLAGLRKEIVLLGVRDHLELWDRVLWDEYLGGKQPQYDEIAEKAFARAAAGTAPAEDAEPDPARSKFPR